MFTVFARPARRIACTLGLLAFAAAGIACAQDYPSKPIRIIVGFPPGGSNDIVARIIAPRMGELLGVSVVVENKPGANATIGTDYVAKSAPDGYTLLVARASPLVITPHTFDKIPYDTVREFAAISTIGVTPEALAVNPSLPVRSLRDLVELSKTRDIAVASAGNGGIAHLAIEVLKKESQGRVVHVPYKGAAPGAADAIAGHVQGILVDLPPLIGFIRDGRLRALAITADKRSDFLPDVPTSAEQGMPALIAVNWAGVLAPAKTPKPIVDKLFDAVVRTVNTPQIREQLIKNAVSPSASSAPAEFQQFLAGEYAKWGRVAKESGARAD